MSRSLPCVLLLVALALGVAPVRSYYAASPTEWRPGRPDDAVRTNILAKLAAEPQLKGLAIQVKVEARRVTLSGRVHTIAQRDLAVRIARDHADGRQVIDDFEIIH